MSHGILLPTVVHMGSHGMSVGSKMAKSTMGHADISWDRMSTMGLWDRMDRGTELWDRGTELWDRGTAWTCRHTMGWDGQRDCTAWSGHADILWDPMCTMGL